MKLYYTGAKENNIAQTDPDKSLGGFLSSTRTPNDLVNNLFGDISKYTIDKKLRETKALILHNDTGVAVTNLNFYFDIPADTYCKFEIAAVTITPDSDGNVFMEKITSFRGSPFSGVFTEADGVANQVLLSASLADDSYLGLWVRRSILDDVKDKFACDQLYADFKNSTPLPESGYVDLVLDWT